MTKVGILLPDGENFLPLEEGFEYKHLTKILHVTGQYVLVQYDTDVFEVRNPLIVN